MEEDLNEGNVGEDDNGGDDFLSFNQHDAGLPNDFDLSTFVQSLKYEEVNTDVQSVVYCHLESLCMNNINILELFICKHWVMVDDILRACAQITAEQWHVSL